MSSNCTVSREFNEKKKILLYLVNLITETDDKTIGKFNALAKRKGRGCLNQDGCLEYIFYTEEDAMTFCIGVDAYFDMLNGNPKDYVTFILLDDLCSKQSYPWGINLYEILRYIIREKGSGILGNTKLIGILDALGAFDVPALRYVFRSIISDGYAIKLLNKGKWNHGAQSLCDEYVRNTGFVYANVYVIFQYIAYGLGWLEEPFSSSPVQYNNGIVPLLWDKGMDEEQTDMFFHSITKYDYWKEITYRAKIKRLYFHVDAIGHLISSCTLYHDRESDFCSSLNCVIYDQNYNVKEYKTIGSLYSFEESERYDYICETKPSNIRRIKLFLSYS